MQSSSLIFVVVVAIWAVYLVQYWVRRRDHLATVRSVDRFSAAMRVLDSHRLSQTAEPARSYAVSPTKAARPQVVVKRAAADHPTRPGRDVTSEHEQASDTRESIGRGALVAAVVDAPRRVRGIALLAHLALLPIVLVVAAFGPLSWWVPVVVLVGLLGSFGWLRQDVKASEAARREEALARRRAGTSAAPARRASRPAPAQSAVRRGSTVVVETARTAERDESASPEAEPSAPDTVSDAPFDVTAESAPAEAPVEDFPTEDLPTEDLPAAAVGAEPVEGTWEPVPVPRPTYTMKAKAEPRAVPADAVPEVLPALDDDVIAPSATPQRRAVGG